MEYIDISIESGRQYFYFDGTQIKIKYPERLTITEEGDHHIIDYDGTEYLVPSGWVAIKRANKGKGVVQVFS